MTNLEYIISALKDEIDDGGASYESVVFYNLACPYRSRDKCRCDDIDTYPLPWEICFECKNEWLQKEYK